MKMLLNELNDAELIVRLNELKQELFNLRFRNASGQETNPMQITRCKKDIARVKTAMRERELKRNKA